MKKKKSISNQKNVNLKAHFIIKYIHILGDDDESENKKRS